MCNVPSPQWNVTRARFLGWQGGGLFIQGTATLTNTNVYSNQAFDVRLPVLSPLNFHPSPHRGLTLLSQLWQGGGIRLWGTIVVANFTGCNIHDNEAWGYVCSPSALLPSRFLHRPDGTLRAPLFGLQGGGVSVRNGMQGSDITVGGVANFEHCNIHENTAPNVCLHL